jgi:serine/threonine protein kinase/Tol biopolymer transport system component
MTPERWRQITDVFHTALARDTAAREAFLEQACGADRDLRGEVDAMLAAHRDAGRFGESAVRGLDSVPLRLAAGAALGPYRIDGLIGAGGMGEVYRAHDSRIGRDVAIKVLPTEYAANAERLRRFEQEARASGALNHPNVLTLYDVGTAADRPYLVMELLDGETLRDRIGRGALTPSRACEMAADVARGLAAAHAKGIVHRDLKPENIMVTRDGRVKILDFGIAKLKAPVPTPDGRTVTTPLRTLAQTVMGTAGYMAPEQVRGLPADERADIFALGAILFEMLTGRRAFDRPSQVETLNAILHDDLPPLEGTAALVPPTVERIVRRCVEKEPDARFQSARDLAFALDNSSGTATATATGVSVPLTRRVVRVREATTFAIAAAIIAGLAVWKFTPRAVPETPPQPLARFAIQPPPGMTFFGRPAISPDGSLLVYAVDQGTASAGAVRRLLLRRLDQLDAAALPGTEGGVSPFFSPDGQSVGFVADGKIKKVSVTTAAASPVVVADAGMFLGGTWAPDNTIIFGNIEHGLQRVSADGGVPQTITPLDRARAEIDHHSPRILPGGKAVLFTIHEGAERFRVGAQVLATGERRALIETGFDAQYSPTGHLVYGNGGSLLAVPFSLDRLVVTGAPVKLLDEVETVAANGEASFSLSPAGTLVFMPAAPRGGRRLAWLNRSGAVTQMPTEPRVFANPRLSPDGERLAVSVEEGERQNIWIYQLRNEMFAPVTFEGRNSAPVWTADGLRLTYSSRRAGVQHLFWQPTDGSSPAESLISSENNLYAGGWAPDGRSLVYMEDPPTSNAEIRVLSMAAGRPSALVPGIPTRVYWPALSPDGRWLAYASWTGPRPDISVQPVPGPGLRRQIVEGGSEPVWSRDGRELFFRSRRGAAPNLTDAGLSDQGIFALPFDPITGAASAKPVQLFRGRFARGTLFAPTYDVTPDGQRFVAVMAGDEEFSPLHLNVIMHIDDELRRRAPPGK